MPVVSDNSYKPKVSILVTSKDEPAHVVIHCIASLAKLEYPNYEVIVINSNSTDRQNYEQIARYVQLLPDNFRFVHLDRVHGFKAGALNYLNRHCISADSVVEAVVDCDYIVSPDFLNHTVGYFKDERVGLVQAPQDYSHIDAHNVGLYYEYRSFFSMVMHQAQRLGLVSFTGT
uniref:Glycos_transf_2 n=1 Tax=uncultured Pseudomonas sp. TaxID=114707 RepID=A0A060BUY2_9PSED|nr:Glycos_transf_2 [uncultured Pseudomonas sp.]